MTKLPYLVLLVASVALASPTPLVMPPSDWQPDPEQSSSLAQKTTRASVFGVPPTASAAEVYVAPQPGAALFVTRTSLELAEVGLAGRAAVDAFTGGARRAELLGAKSEVLETTEADDAKQHVVTLTWRDGAEKITTATRLVLAANAAGLVAVTGECVWTDAAATLAPACKQALASLDTGIPVADRIAIVLAAPAAAAAGSAAAPASGTEVPTTPTRTTIPARIDDSGKVHLSPMTIAQTPRDKDHRPVYVGLGIIVLAAVFWWNRRQREKFDRSDAAVRGDAPPAADDDADDLHAAAAAAPAKAPKDEA